MNQIRIFTVLCAGLLQWMACTTDDHKSTILSDAMHAVDNNPQEALTLLESIADPDILSESDKDQYMQYVVILTQTRSMNDQEITGDSLILDAQRYFAWNGNYEMAARASYYAAAYWYKEEAGDKAVEYWQAAFHFAERAGNNLFMSKSAHWIGISYYNQEQWEDALPYCQKALAFYDDMPDFGQYKLDVAEMLGQIYRELQDPELAYRYFDDGLEAAKNLNNIKYESRFLRNKGHIHLDKGELRQAKAYFDRALSKQPETEEMLRIDLSYAKLYRAMNLPDSTLHYLCMIENRIPEITYPNTRRDIYAELMTFYKSNRDSGEKIAHYANLAHTEDLRIKKSQSDKKIEAVNQQLEELIRKKQNEMQTYRRIINYGAIAVLLLVSLLVAILVNRRWIKEKYNKNREALFFQTLDQQRFLMAGLRSIAKSADELYQKELAYAGSPVWEQLLVLRQEFSLRVAECTGQDLERLHNGKKALSKLTHEDLSIIYLSQHRLLPDDYIGRMLGHQGNAEQYIMIRKGQIRRILTDAGMRDRDVRVLLL